jgi:hypothetical protein
MCSCGRGCDEVTRRRFCTRARPTAWLGWSDSNCGIRWDQSPPVLPGNFSGFGRNGRSRDGSRASCGVTNVQLLQRFRLVLRAHAEWQRGCSTCLAGRIRTSVGAKKIIPHRASFCARLVARTEHAWWPEPDRLTPLPRQRPWASAGFGWWRRVVAPPHYVTQPCPR